MIWYNDLWPVLRSTHVELNSDAGACVWERVSVHLDKEEYGEKYLS